MKILLLFITIFCLGCTSSHHRSTVDRIPKEFDQIPNGWGLYKVTSSTKSYAVNLSRIRNGKYGLDVVIRGNGESIGNLLLPLGIQNQEKFTGKLHVVSEQIILIFDNGEEWDLSKDIVPNPDFIRFFSIDQKIL